MSWGPHAWALRLELTEVAEDDLSDAAAAGLDYARALAENARERSADPRRALRPDPLTPQQLAAEYHLPVKTVQARIDRARRELFGSLTDGAIAKRGQRQKDRRYRNCQHSGCDRLILSPAHGSRQYCHDHQTGKERAQRHRAKKKINATD